MNAGDQLRKAIRSTDFEPTKLLLKSAFNKSTCQTSSLRQVKNTEVAENLHLEFNMFTMPPTSILFA